MHITTTLNRIRAHRPCADGWAKLLAGLGKTAADDEPLPYARILEINGIDDAFWACCAEPQHSREWRLIAVWCARQVEHLLTDQRSKDALDVAERFANGEADEEELASASDAAWSAAWAAARDAASDAAWAAARAAAGAAAGAAQNKDLASAMLGLVTTYSFKDGPCFCYDFSGHEPETHQDFCITARAALSPEPEAK